MEMRQFGRTGREVSVIGQGTWFAERGDKATVVAAIQRGLDLGMNHIDTAELYGGGLAEDVVAGAIAGRRQDAFVVSKVHPENASRRGTVAACERSLVNLQTGYLDSYLLHWRGRYPLEETIAAFEQLVQEGKILSWGVSNFAVADLEEAWSLAGERGLTSNQVLYHLEDRGIEHDILPWCEAHDVVVTGYSPFGHGRFPSTSSPGGRVLARIADAHGATPRQVAMRFLVRRPLLITIPKASTLPHTEDNAGAGDLQLSAAEIAEIDAAFPLGPRPRVAPRLFSPGY